MDILNKINQLHSSDFTKLISGFIFLLYFLYKKIDHLDFMMISEFSFLERILVVLIISLVIGKIGSQFGHIIFTFFKWLLFNNKRGGSLRDDFESFISIMTPGSKPIKDDVKVIKTEILSFIEKDKEIKNHYFDLFNTVIFWKSILGLSTLSIIFFRNEAEILFFIILFPLSLIFSFYNQFELSNFWSECATGVNREKEKSK